MRGLLMTTDIRGLKLIHAPLGDVIVELGRITYKSSSVSLYLPKRICDVLQLDKDVNNSLVIVSMGDNCILLVKDTAIAAALKPKILEMRKEICKMNRFQNFANFSPPK